MISVVVIGASTGGPAALNIVVSKLPSDFPVPVVVIQHMMPNFTRIFAKSLSQKCVIGVKEGDQGELLKSRCVYIAPAGKHLTFNNGRIHLNEQPPRNYVRPSIDITMESAAQNYEDSIIGVILTGIGKDGVDGVKAIKQAGGVTIAQDEHTSVVFGMPKKAIESGCVDYVLPLDEIAGKLIDLVKDK